MVPWSSNHGILNRNWQPRTHLCCDPQPNMLVASSLPIGRSSRLPGRRSAAGHRPHRPSCPAAPAALLGLVNEVGRLHLGEVLWNAFAGLLRQSVQVAAFARPGFLSVGQRTFRA
jgi:hypothetical protein